VIRRRTVRTLAAVALCSAAAVVLPMLGRATAQPASAAPDAPREVAGDASTLRMEMRNVFLHVNAHGGLHVATLRGEAVSTTPGAVAVLDDPRSFSVRVSAGTVALGGDDLGALLNDVVFAYPNAPLRQLQVRITDAGIVQSGILHKGVDLRFVMAARLTLQPDGRIRIHPTRLTILGVDGGKLLRALGLHLDNMLDLRGAHGITAEGDDLLMDPIAVIPPPHVTGQVAAMRLEDAMIVLDFARTPADAEFEAAVHPDSAAHNFVYFRGGRLRFGKLEMRDTDLLIRDADESDPFDLYLAHYAQQLTAGTSRTLPNEGLVVRMPDYHRLAAP